MYGVKSRAASGFMAHTQTFITLISAIVGVVASVLALFSKQDADEYAKDALEIKHALETRAAERADKEMQAKLDALAYEAVVKVLEIDHAKVEEAFAEKRERAVLALIAVTASGSMQSALFDVIQSGAFVSESVKGEAAAASEFLKINGNQASDASTAVQSETSATNFNPSLLKNYRIAVFYCGSETSPHSARMQRHIAEMFVAEMAENPITQEYSIKWETKLLPSVLNSSPGYSIFNNEIRFNPSDGETEASQALLNILKTSKTLGAFSATFERKIVNQRTSGYLSVFVCGITSVGYGGDSKSD